MKNQKGVTLIALVVTIIVLLILAGVSIAMLTGENGILTQATESKNSTKLAEAKEAVEMFMTEKTIEYYKGNQAETLDEFLGAALGESDKPTVADCEITYASNKVTVTVKNTNPTLTSDGTITNGKITWSK